MIERASWSETPAFASAAVYADREPPKRFAISPRSAVSTCARVTLAMRLSITRANPAVYARSRSCVSFWIWETVDCEIRSLPTTHCVPGVKTSCPSVSDEFHPGPAPPGPLHNDDARTQSQTHAALPKAGSLLPVYDVQPQDQIVEKCSSCATCLAPSACHFTTSNHA